MNRRPDFALWCGLVAMAVYAAAAFHIPAADRLAHAVGFYAGRACTVVGLVTVVVGVPVLARRCRAGFWRGSFAVAAAAGWLVLPFWFLFVSIGPAFAVIAAAGLNFVAAVVCAVILRRRRRARRLEAPNVADVFS